MAETNQYKYMKRQKIVSAVLAITALMFGLAGPITVLAAGPASVNLGAASNFAVLSKSGISTTGATLVTGDIGVSPINATAITGFGLTVDSSNVFAKSALVVGKIFAADYAAPTPANMTTAISDMQTVYTDAAGRTNPTATELGAGNIGGMTLAPGLYKWGTGLAIPTDVTLSGSANDIWIFQVGQNLNLSPAKQIILAGGAKASNIFWVVAGQTTIGTTAVFNGTILGQTAIVLNTGAVLNGRALAQTAVTLDANTVATPSHNIVVPDPVLVPVTSTIPATTTIPATPAVPAIPATPTSATNTSTVSATPATPATPVTPTTPVIQTTINQTEEFPTTPHKFQEQEMSQNSIGQQVGAIARNLGQGHRNDNVKTLQQFLISQNIGSASKNLTRVGATSYFGPLTRASLAEFQAKVGISPAWGNFGPITRAYLKANFN
ncbi:MAG: hypothetical protein A3J93_00580 [Candidatus Magasanikbacteria bacterium RIFOXYC2_FULL_42_28]|uniref:Peptidoglycan binding-like domain-containing protein n=1 Tax=Candidatus Magasanikbacteria bacterium RIFOXYC2_FULL_42_28 TaxID=1798704 RepID=A0A1F6NXY8_9BACT|nr:MAG: hypothetical protein A3J93_00580 [Candidatus Magasanikbacteria bacterium RIFOXYC2_FULL_42_28]